MTKTPFLAAILTAAACAAASAQVVGPIVHGMAPAPAPLAVPPPLRSCVEPGTPQQLLGLQTELMLAARTLVPAGTPAPEALPSAGLRSFAKLTTARELDLFMVGMMPQAPALQAALAKARQDGGPEAVKSALATVETAYGGAVKAFALAVAKSYQEGALDMEQLGQARRALEEYTEHGAFVKETAEAFFRMEQYARRSDTLSYARRNAELLLDGLAREDLPFRPAPLIHPAQTSTLLDYFEMESVFPGDKPATDLIIERLKSAVESLRPAPGREVLLVRLLSNAYATEDKFLLVDTKRRGELLTRLQDSIRAEAAKAGLQVIFRDEVEKLRVRSEDAVILSLRHSEADQEFNLLGWKPRARSYATEVYLVGAKRPSSGLLVPAPQPTPESMARWQAAKRWLMRAGALPAVAAAVYAAAQHIMPQAALWSQVPFAGQAAIAVAVAASLIILIDKLAGLGKKVTGVPAWKWRAAAVVMLGLGALAAAKRAYKLAVAGGVGALVLAWLTSGKKGTAPVNPAQEGN